MGFREEGAVPEVSIVIPLYNEVACVGPLIGALDRLMAGFDRSTEVILVDDGSTDGTAEEAQECICSRPAYRLVMLRANCGQTQAMAAGLELARGEFIVFMDGDLQNDPADIPMLLEKIDSGYDLVSGWRRDRKDRALSRKIPSKAANWLIGLVTGVRVHDYGCSLKAYRASLIKGQNLYSDMHRFLPALCSRGGARITEVVVRHHPRTLGSSKYGLNRVFKVAADLTVIKMIVSFADRPLHYFGMLSLLFLILTAVTSGFWAWNLMEDWYEGTIILPSIIILLFCCFLFFLFMGLLADLIVRVGPRERTDLSTQGVMEVH